MARARLRQRFGWSHGGRFDGYRRIVRPRFLGELKFRRIIVIVATVGCVIAVSSVAGAKTVPAGSWAPKFCSALRSWQQKLQSDGNTAQSALSGNVSDLKGAKSSWSHSWTGLPRTRRRGEEPAEGGSA